MDSEPLVALEPDQPPDALQLLASVEDHVSVMLSPFRIVEGLALSETVGAGADTGLTVTVVLLFALPPAPSQVMV